MKKVPIFPNKKIPSKFLLFFLAIGLWISINSCSKSELEGSEVSPVSKSISIEDARNWYTKQSANGRISADLIKARMPYWKYAKNDQLSNGRSTVIVPLLYNFGEPISISPGAKFDIGTDGVPRIKLNKEEARIQKKLLITKDDNGNYISSVLVIIPTIQNRKQNKEVKKERFNGTVMVFDESEKYFILV